VSPTLIGAVFGAAGCLAGGALALGYRAQRERARVDATAAKSARDRSAANEQRLAGALAAEKTAHEITRVRLERTAQGLKNGIAKLEEDLDACDDVAVVRARLRRLLQDPTGEHGTEGGGEPRLPAGTTAAVGPGHGLG
jgi:hypothetical protein